MRITAIWSFLGLVALGASGVLSGCDSDDPAVKSAVGESCVKTSDCVDGLKCLEGACYRGPANNGEGGTDSEPGPVPPVLSGLGETCTKRADCADGLSCFNARCAEEPEGEGGASPGPTLGGIGETCVLTADCLEPLACYPSAGLGSVGVCTPATTGLTPTGNDCHAECKEAADCCELPVLYHQPYDALTYTWGTGAASCVELDSLLTAVDCATTVLPAELARCFAFDTFCSCADDTWSCSDAGACVYETECTVSGAAPGGCPALSRSGRPLLQVCSAEGACAPAAGPCTDDDSCTGKPVADAIDTCVADECTCYNELGCYRKCSVDLDCAVGQVCNDDAVCETAPFCESDEHCAALAKDFRSKCSAATNTCYTPCENDRDCNPAGVTGQLTMLCNADKMCQLIGCTSDNDCPAPGPNAGGVKNFCTPQLDPTFVPTVASAITDGP